MKRPAHFLVLALLLAGLAACGEEDLVSTGIQNNAASAPTLSNLSVRNDASGAVQLTAAAKDPLGSPLTLSWKADQGTLSTKSGPSVLWLPPKQAGTYVVTVEITNAKGQKVTASQRLLVSDKGETSASGQAEVTTAAPAGSGTNGSGQFQVPGSVPGSTPSVFVVGANPDAPGPGGPTPVPAFEQPVATPVPGTTPIASPPGQPIALPTLTPSPASPVPTPTLPAPLTTSEPGVPMPPNPMWVQVPPIDVPFTGSLYGVQFLSGSGFNTGFAVGAAGTVLKSTDGGQHWGYANTGLPATTTFKKVVFTSSSSGSISGGGYDQAGFIAGDTQLYRSANLGTTWEAIPLPNVQSVITSMTVYNARVVVLATTDGRVLRSENANAQNPANVSWTSIETKPPARPGDVVTSIAGGAIYPSSDLTLGLFVGDGIYRLDSDGTPDWSRRMQFQDAVDRPSSAVSLSSPLDAWVGTTNGRIYHSTDGGASWSLNTDQNHFLNREHNGVENNLYLQPRNFIGLCFLSNLRGWALTPLRVYDTENGGQSWKEVALPAAVNAFQICPITLNGNQTFVGWGVGPNGAIVRYLPVQ